MMDKLKAFSQTFGVHPLVAFSLFAIDWMLFSSEIVTIGTSWLVTAPIGLLLGCGAILLQRYSFQDRLGIAIGKGLLLGILTAIPTALPSLGMIPLAAIGAIKLLSDKSSPPTNDNAKQLASISIK